MPYGLLTPTDVQVLEDGLRLAMKTFPGSIRVVEIGVCYGDTSRGIRTFLETHGRELDYCGFDNQRDRPIDPPFPGATVHLGDSAETYLLAPSGIHFLLIDGCHCANHVMLDFLNFGDRVVPHGLVFFHDVNPKAQGKMDHQGHGPRHVDFGTATREALRKLGLFPINSAAWGIVNAKWDDQDWGGALLLGRFP